MGIFLAFSPFIAFALIDRIVGSVEGLAAGAIVSLGLLLRDWATPGRSPKILEIGTALLFCSLALVAALMHPDWSIMGVRLRVDGGLLVIILGSIALRRPFTLQYAREQVNQAQWHEPEFVRVNYVITAVWALAFVVLIVADIVMVYAPQTPPKFAIIAAIVALVGAVKFTGWYPQRGQPANPVA